MIHFLVFNFFVMSEAFCREEAKRGGLKSLCFHEKRMLNGIVCACKVKGGLSDVKSVRGKSVNKVFLCCSSNVEIVKDWFF